MKIKDPSGTLRCICLRLGWQRIYVVYLSDELGGSQAAKLVAERFSKIHDFRQISGPTRTMDILQEMRFAEGVLEAALQTTAVLLGNPTSCDFVCAKGAPWLL